MATDYTTSGLIATIRLRASVPNNQQLMSDDNSLIMFLNDEMHNMMVPDLMLVKEEYFVDFDDFQTTIKSDGTWQDTYEIPYQAIGMKLRDLTTLGSANNGTTTQPFSVPRITPEAVANSGNRSNNYGISFYARGSSVVFWPTPVSQFTFRMSYFRRPNDLVSVSQAGQILSINPSLNTVVLTNLPSSWSTAQTVDCIQYYPGFDATAQNIQITSVSNPTLGLSDVSNMAVGDWISISGTSPVPQLPVECQSVLAQAAVVKLLESQKDKDGVQIAQQKYEEIKGKMFEMITPRVDGEMTKITSNGRGLIDYRSNNYWNGYY